MTLELEAAVELGSAGIGTRERRVALLKPLVDRLVTSHFWRRGTKLSHVREPFTPAHLSEHAAGTGIYGLAFVKPGGSTTRAACVDFDSHGGEIAFSEMHRIADAVAFDLEQQGFRPSLWRSSGGNGIHLWLAWNSDEDAFSVRQMLLATLATHGLKDGAGGVHKQQAEVNPKQIEIDPDKFGSMVVLPLAKKSSPLGNFTGFVASPSVPRLQRPERVPRPSTSTPVELARLESALQALPDDVRDERNTWRDVGFSIHHATGGSDEGLELFQKWSSPSPKYDEEGVDALWTSIRPDREGALITGEHLLRKARSYGWNDPTMADGFEVLEEVPAGAPKRGFTFEQAAEFSEGPPVSWLVKDVLPKADLGVIYGKSGSGKSFFALDLACAIARGVEWRGNRVTKGRVAYIVAEGIGGFRKRLKAYAKHYQLDLARLAVFVLADTPRFAERASVLDVVAAMKRVGSFDLVIVDTLAQVSAGSDENSGKEMGVVLDHCKLIHQLTGGMVLLISHSGKDESRGMRGWSGVKGALDVEIEVTRPDSGRRARISKMKDDEEGAKFGFRLATVPVGADADGDPITSCVVEHTHAAEAGGFEIEACFTIGPKAVNQRLAWEAVRDLARPDGALPSREDVYREASLLMSSGTPTKRRQGMVRALGALIASGHVVETARGLMVGQGSK